MISFIDDLAKHASHLIQFRIMGHGMWEGFISLLICFQEYIGFT